MVSFSFEATRCFGKDFFTSSTVQVIYFEEDHHQYAPLLTLHYDFPQKDSVTHPFFHVQFGDSSISSEDLKNVGFRGCLNKGPNFQSRVRIPTPHMSLSSVLLGIIADHFGDDDKTNNKTSSFLTFLRSREVSKLRVPVHFDTTKFDSEVAPWHSYHWYKTA